MKYAILISGNFRTWEQSKSSFLNAFGELDADIFLSTYDLRFDYHPFIKLKIGDQSDVLVDKETIIGSFNDMKLRGINYEPSAVVNTIDHSQFVENFRNIGNPTFAQMRKLQQGANLIKSYENQNQFKYDIIIKTRFDLAYNKIPFDQNFDNIIVFDRGNVYPNDCVYISSRNNMLSIFDIMYNEFFHQTDLGSHLHPPHGLLHAAVKRLGLIESALPIMQYVIRKNGLLQHY